MRPGALEAAPDQRTGRVSEAQAGRLANTKARYQIPCTQVKNKIA
jgi:hypothetical protein